jgi:Flp pilus assembly protein TadG
MPRQEIRTKLDNQHGQSIVLIAVAMLVLIGMMGLVLDGGFMYFTRRNTQNAADSAAYAGARVFSMRADNSPSSTQLVWDAINTYATANYVQSANALTAWYVDASGNMLTQINQSPFPAIPSSATGVRVLAAQQYTPAVISIIRGNAPLTVSTPATVQVGPLVAPKQLMPMAVITTNPDIPYRTLVTIQGGSQGSGAYQWVDFGLQQCGSYGGGANILVGLLSIPQGCSPPPVVANETWPWSESWIESKPGLSPNNNITIALDEWLALPQDQRLWLVPVTYCSGDPSLGFPTGCGQGGGGTNIYYYTTAFGEFQLIGYCWNNKCNGDSSNPPLTSCPGYDQQKDFICGMFVKMDDSGYAGGPGACNTNGLNVCAMLLTE